MSLFEELKRRRVFRLIAAYVVVAWVIIQVVTAIEEPLNLPDWFDTAVIVLLGLGFPIAIIMSWVYDVTPEGVVREDGSSVRVMSIDYGKIALVAVLILGAFLIGNYISDDSSGPAVGSTTRADLQRFEIGLPNDLEREAGEARPIVTTPDGRRIVFRAKANRQYQIFVRAIDSLEVLPVAETEGADRHFAVSPDGTSVAFYTQDDGLIKKVSLDGGIATPLTSAGGTVDHIDWGANGAIVFTNGKNRGLMRVSSAGGETTEFVSTQDDDVYKHPTFIPGTDWVVFVVGDGGRGNSQSFSDSIALASPDGDVKATSLNGSSPQVSVDGQLLFFRRNAVWSVSFDIENLEVTGDPVPIIDDVFYSRTGHYDISAEGSLIYVRESSIGENSLVWVDREGVEQPAPLARARYSFPAVSPDGDLVAVVEATPFGPDLWTHSLSRGDSTRWTSDEERESSPVWSPDGSYLYFESKTRFDTYRVAIQGDGNIEQLTDTVVGRWPADVLPDGRIIIDEWGSTVADGSNVVILDPAGSGGIEYLMQSEYRESHAKLSPDGNLLAYMSDRGGSLEVFVRRFPIIDDQWIRVSVSGESWNPRWSANSHELFFWDQDDNLMYSVQIETTPELSAAKPVPLFDTKPYAWQAITNYDYDPVRDRFLMIKKPPVGSTSDEIVLIQNWQELLTEQAP